MRLRRAEDSDSRFLFDLRNHPVIRESSFNTEELQFEKHEVWFKRALSDSSTTILIGVQNSDSRIGMIRFEKKERSAIVSIAISPNHQNKGYGTLLLNEGCDLYFSQEDDVNEIVAEIKKENIASVKAFGKACFVETGFLEDRVLMSLYRPVNQYSLGVKIFTTNQSAFRKLRELHEKKIIDFVELYLVPNVIDTESLEKLKEIPIIFHAPNFNHGFDLREKNRVFDESLNTLRVISEFLNEKTVIFHPGLEQGVDDIETIIATLRELSKKYDIVLENMPKKPIKGNKDIIASEYDEFRKIITETGLKVCVDFGHTICSANYYGEDPLDYIKKFVDLEPFMFHIGDGEYTSISDVHNHLSEGDFPLEKIISLIPLGSRITLETPKSDFVLLSQDLVNLQRLKNLIRTVNQSLM